MSDQFGEDWQAAAGDAAIEPSSVVLCPLPANGRYGAMHFPPGQWPHQHDDAFAYDDGRRLELYELRNSHVIVVDENLASPKRLLVLRHEAEHVGQHDGHASVSEVGLRLAVALPSEWLYLAMPHERDADAAATRLADDREIVGTAEDLEGRDRFLYAAPWAPPDRDSLRLRLLAFTLFYPDDFDLACTSNQYWPYVNPVTLIDELIEGGSAARAQLRGLFTGFLEEVTDHGITQQQWDSMTTAERNVINDQLRTRVVEAEDDALEQLRAFGL